MKTWKRIIQFAILTASMISEGLIVWCFLVDKDFQKATFFAVMALYLYWQFKEGEK